MTKDNSLLLVLAAMVILLIALWLFVSYMLSKTFKQYSFYTWRKLVGRGIIILFVFFVGYLFYWLQNYGC